MLAQQPLICLEQPQGSFKMSSRFYCFSHLKASKGFPVPSSRTPISLAELSRPSGYGLFLTHACHCLTILLQLVHIGFSERAVTVCQQPLFCLHGWPVPSLCQVWDASFPSHLTWSVCFLCVPAYFLPSGSEHDDHIMGLLVCHLTLINPELQDHRAGVSHVALCRMPSTLLSEWISIICTYYEVICLHISNYPTFTKLQ